MIICANVPTRRGDDGRYGAVCIDGAKNDCYVTRGFYLERYAKAVLPKACHLFAFERDVLSMPHSGKSIKLRNE